MDKEKIIEENKKLVERYPFLIVRNRFTMEIVDGYDFSFTELDALPHGWSIAFGMRMLEELRTILEKADYVEKYRITQIKEKYGFLHWYDCGVPRSIGDEYNQWQNKYVKLSKETCIRCGEKAEYVSLGWISPYCCTCKKELENKICFVTLDEFQNGDWL